MKRIILLTCIAAIWLLASCGAPFRCLNERIEITLPAAITRGGAQQNESLSGAVTSGNVGEDIFAALKSVLIEDPSARSLGLVWSVPAFNTNGGGLAVALAAPLRVGEVLQITNSFQGGGWGYFDLPGEMRAQVSVRSEDFVATSASGTVQVVQIAPLVLRLDIAVTDANSETMRIRGDASFHFVREKVPCT